jgi:intermediate peptidase
MYLLSHGHFVAYGGAYHSYLLSKMYAAHLWHRLFERDPLSRQAGETLHRDMLAHGAATDTRAMLSQLVGGELDPRHYTKTLRS